MTSNRLLIVTRTVLMNYIGVDLGASAVSKRPSSAVAILDDTGHLVDNCHMSKHLVADISG